MPIVRPRCLGPLAQEEFAGLDYRVMRLAFDSQNELGRLCDEVIYQHDLASRVEAEGLGPVRTEVPVTITYREFAKTLSFDLLVGDAAVYELKEVSRLASDHEAQLLNYLFLTGLAHGKLINFRSPQVESRFVNAALTTEARRDFDTDTCRWQETTKTSETLRTGLIGLLQDWGGFLELSLYKEALTHLLGGADNVIKMIPLSRDGLRLGNQKLYLPDPETAFRLTSLSEGVEHYEPHLRALLRCSPLRAIQWINLGRHRIQFVTLSK